MKTAIYSLYQSKELKRGKYFVRQCLPQLNADRQLLVLVNDSGFDEFAVYCRGLSPYITVLGGEGNLGVAGGRNFLIRHGIRNGFEFMISCDNDIIIGPDYFERIELGYAKAKANDARIGLVQPVLLDGRKIKPLLGLDGVAGWNEIGGDGKTHGQPLAGGWAMLVSKLGEEKALESVYHAGVSNPWKAHFSGPLPSRSSDLPWDDEHVATYGTAEATMRQSPERLSRVLAAGEPLRVFTVAGGITAFHKDAIEVVGEYNQMFNPFGYEDSELGFRSTQMALKNYLLTDVFAAHDPFMGVSNRDLYSHATIARLRAIELAGMGAVDRRRDYSLGQSLLFCWPAHDRQLLDALKQGEVSRDALPAAAASFVASYALNFLYGLFGTRASPRGSGNLLDRILPQGFTKYQEQDVSIGMGRGCCFKASDILVERSIGPVGLQIASAAAMNCRLEEVADAGARVSSRYFDAYLVLAETAVNQFELRINLQSNAQTFAAKIAMDVTDALATEFRAPPRVNVLSSQFNTYDVGAFSVENIYPAPKFEKSSAWVLELKGAVESLRASGGAYSWLLEPVLAYLLQQPHDPKWVVAAEKAAASGQPVAVKASTPVATPPGATPAPVARMTLGRRKPRILVFTDSRGQHKPSGCNHDVFAERLAKDPNLEVTTFLCPMKWTTTLDFLMSFTEEQLAAYDHVILYTGIVEWSPRKCSNAIGDLYDRKEAENLGNIGLNTRDYSKKVVNSKKAIFDEVFGEASLAEYYSRPFDAEYEGEKTINMYPLDLGVDRLARRLANIPNLIFLNANRIVSGWNGDYPRERPSNMSVIHDYSASFAACFPSSRIIDLMQWSDEEVKRYTCDNLHLTKDGSDWIYERIMSAISSRRAGMENKSAKRDSILLIGNGSSTKMLAEFGFENLPDGLDTFGMGAAYRYFSQVGWWPTYHAWCDIKVVHSHREAFKTIVEDDRIPLKKLFLSLPVSESERFELVPHSSTGDFCFRKAVELGYKNIYFIGVEGDYVEEVPGSRPLTDDEYRDLGFHEPFLLFSKEMQDKTEAEELFKKYLRIIDRTPESNPNYFFEGYQQRGDVYSLPRTRTHVNAWSRAAALSRKSGVLAFNLSPTSKIVDFAKIPLSGALMRVEDSAAGLQPVAPYGFPMGVPRPLSAGERSAALRTAGLEPKDRLASLVIGLKIVPDDHARHRNLLFLLDWIDTFYGDLFEVLLVEQGTESRIHEVASAFRPYVRHEFLYNPGPYNRGWGYNVAARHLSDLKVMAFLDTDVLTGDNFLDEVVACHTTHKVISPYSTVYFSNESEADQVCDTYSFANLQRSDGVKKPTTLTGGIVIVRRDVFLELKGFEQYTEYAGEDRALDVTFLNHCDSRDIRMAPFTYVHLHHAAGLEERPRANELFAHLRENYGCRVDPSVLPGEDIHKNCKHQSRKKTLQLMLARSASFGTKDLYSSGNALAVNGVPQRAVDREGQGNVIFPPAIRDGGVKDLSKYPEKEILGSANSLDRDLLSQFHNAFKGERCFIIGNGPSLNRHDLSLLEGEYTFGVNSFYYKTRETGFRPFFYVVEDTSVMNENVDEIRNYYAPFRFFPAIYKNLIPRTPNTFFFEMNRGFYEKSSPNYVVPRFSTDASKTLYCGQSVTYINLQLAYFMGFTEVYLIGMDFSYVIPDEHKRTGDLILSTTDDPNHFHKDYFGKGKSWKDPKLDRVALNYQMAKLVYEGTGRRVFNATIGGSLEIFDRVDYERLLKPSADGNGITSKASSLREANNLYRSQNYAGALSVFVQLARADEGFALYRRSALDAFLRAREAGQSCAASDVSFVRSQVGI